MKLIVGLGNPGLRYRRTRHNAGFMALDAFAKDLSGKWKMKKEWNAETASVDIGDETILLVKPQTYMNASGDSVRRIVHDKKITPRDILIVQDDLDIEPGAFQFKNGGGAAGHNGIKDIYQKLGSDACGRLRLGVGRSDKPIPQDRWVMGRLSPKDLPSPLDMNAGMRDWIEYGIEYASNRWNGKNQKTTD